jgi:hypothetical protein
MFDKWLKLPAHYYLNLTALSILIVGVSLSNVLMSIGTIWIIANWLIEMDFINKWERFKSNKTTQAISLFFLLMLVSLLWSEDLDYAFKDLLVKLPLITIPLVMGTSKQLDDKIYIFLLYIFIGTLAFTTVFNYLRFNSGTYGDIREMSFFISHIRLGGLICIAIFLSGYQIITKKLNVLFTLPILIWLIFYLYKSQTLTAYILIIFLFIISLFYMIKGSKFKYLLAFAILIITIITGIFVKNNIATPKLNSQIISSELEGYTLNGNYYYHDTVATLSENGNLVWINVCIKECETEWNNRSIISYDSTDAKGQAVYGSLLRYMTSLNLKKDSIGFLSLTTQDIQNIENGHTNALINKGITGKINELSLEYFTYNAGGDPNGHSFIQRLEHLKTAKTLVQKNWLFGVGLGDVKLAFNAQYDLDNSLLNIDNRHRSHNQFLTTWISLGILGFLLLIFILFWPILDKNINFSVLIISISLIFAFFTQDMIETQAGVTIFALFYSLVNYKEKHGSKIR